MGLPGAKQKNAGPRRPLALLRTFFETAERMIDEVVKRSKTGAIQILCGRKLQMLAIGQWNIQNGYHM
eukprot:4748899-Pyramimonas_sp.AAC.1